MGCGCNKRAAAAASIGGGELFLRSLGFTTAGMRDAMDDLTDVRLLVKSRIVRRTGKVKGEYLPGDVTTGGRITAMGLSVRGLMATGSLRLAEGGDGDPIDPRPIGGHNGLSGDVAKKLARAGYGPGDYARLTNDHLNAVFALDSAGIRAFRGVYPNPATGMLATGAGAPAAVEAPTDAPEAADSDAQGDAPAADTVSVEAPTDAPADVTDGLRATRGRVKHG